MLRIHIDEQQYLNESTNEIITVKAQTLQMEHSLVSISKWESKWHVPFLGKQEKTQEQILDYLNCMTLTQNVDPNVFLFLSNDTVKKINEYISDPMTATTISDYGAKKSREIITSEVIYFWMVNFNIPFECQKWHLNRLLTLIEVCNAKNSPGKKMSRSEVMNRNRMLNEARRKKYQSKG